MKSTAPPVIDLGYLRSSIAAGWVPLDPRTLLALIEAIEADHAWHVLATPVNWQRREQAFSFFLYAPEPTRLEDRRR